jgi:hypothetical protein
MASSGVDAANEMHDGGVGVIGDDFASGLIITGNHIHDNVFGIIFDDLIDSTISSNHVMDNTIDGIGLREVSTGNIVESNLTSGHGNFDLIHEGSSNLNTWVGNGCETKSGEDIPDC